LATVLQTVNDGMCIFSLLKTTV